MRSRQAEQEKVSVGTHSKRRSKKKPNAKSGALKKDRKQGRSEANTDRLHVSEAKRCGNYTVRISGEGKGKDNLQRWKAGLPRSQGVLSGIGRTKKGFSRKGTHPHRL